MTELFTDAPSYPMRRTHPLAPPPALDELRHHRPVCPVTLWNGQHAWLVTRNSDVRKVLGDPRVSADPHSPGYPSLSKGRSEAPDRAGSFNHLDPPQHDVFRNMLSGEFTVRAISRMSPLVQHIVDNVISSMLAGPRPVDLVTAFALPVPSQVICAILGVPYEDHAFFESRTATRMDLGASPATVRSANEEILSYLHELVARKTRHPQDDLLSRLAVRHVLSGSLTHEALVDMARLLLVNGYETTANMLSLSVLALLQAPEQMAELTRDPSAQAVKNAVEELLRHQTIVHIAPTRAVLSDIEVGGQTIKAGEGVITSLASANQDDDVFEDPQTLDISRDARWHLAFGHGIHHCLGHPLARLELQTALGTLLRRIPALRLAVPLSDVPFKHDGGLYGVHRLPVSW
ncbi:cytochrome P450 [Streptomyces sp. NPDC059785]|uniref:cytochrome P450 n=1 Tax=unclassified Streptomyces TaxID=2593676 RepID=UPI0036675F86